MKIICVGRNYAEHARELNSPVTEEPVFFLKADSSLLIRNRPFFHPEFSKEIHYEVELVIKINRLGKYIQEKHAGSYYNEIGLGIDFTARDIQNTCKQKGLPWAPAKAFDNSAPVSRFITFDKLHDRENILFHLNLNGKTVQKGNSGDMIFGFDYLVSYLSRFFTLKTGDLIFTGTPAGVGPVRPGDRLTAYLENRKMLDFLVK
jgi:2-keto-4-pentenoate hydratase/2-oxohepta-3-ene-1,7-dioic acid hydratase in catechol pathway